MSDGQPACEEAVTLHSQQRLALRGTILIVDDEESLGRGLARVLRKKGFTVELATTGERALELISTASFGVVLTDITMPGLSGVDLLRRVRELGLRVPVVLMTGDPSSAAAAMASDAFALLTKPLDHDDLVATLEGATGCGAP